MWDLGSTFKIPTIFSLIQEQEEDKEDDDDDDDDLINLLWPRNPPIQEEDMNSISSPPLFLDLITLLSYSSATKIAISAIFIIKFNTLSLSLSSLSSPISLSLS